LELSGVPDTITGARIGNKTIDKTDEFLATESKYKVI
jgi:hypothetical protein